MVGIVLSIESGTDIPANKLKQVISVLDEGALVPEGIIQLCQWAARYYHHSIGETLHQALPKNLHLGKPASTGSMPFWYPLVEPDSELRNQLKKNKKTKKTEKE